MPPATAVTTFPVINQTSMTVTWLPGGNPLNVTSYTVVFSTEGSNITVIWVDQDDEQGT